MSAKLKCSKCGAEIDTINFGWGKWNWLWLPLAFLPLILVYWSSPLLRPKGDYTNDLAVALMESQFGKDKVNVWGKVTNAGKHDWQSVEVLAEVYDNKGRFLAQQSQNLAGSLRPGAERQFRIGLYTPAGEPAAPDSKVVLKVVGAMHLPF